MQASAGRADLDEGDEDLERKAPTLYVAINQPLGVAPIQNNPGRDGFSDNTPPASTCRNRPGTHGPTNEGKGPAPRVNRSFHGEEKVETRVEEANHVSCGLLQSAPPALNDPPTAQRTTPMAHQDNIVNTPSAPVAGHWSSKPRLSNPEGQGTVQYVNFLVLEGYSVQIAGGKHFSTPEGEFVELRSGTQYKILLKNSHHYACNVDISIDGYDVGGWIVYGGEQFTIERSAYEAKKFTFYRVKKAPKDSGIDPSRTEENGVVKCVFSPEAFVDIPVTVSGSSQPLLVRFAPSATVGDLKEEIQKQLNKSPDRNQILALNNKELENHIRVRSVIESPESLTLVDVELDVTVEASTNKRCQIKIQPGKAKISDLMQKIEAELEVPIKDQKLFYGKTRLSDNPHKGLPEKLIYSLNRTLVVIVPDYIEITVENSASGESITLKIDKEKCLTDLVEEIPSCRNMDDNQEAMFLVDGRELSPVKDTGKLKSLGICPGSRVKLEVRVLFIKVFVVGHPQGRLAVQCNPLETFQDLLNHVQSRTKMAKIDDATFSTEGRVFDPKKDLNTLQDYGIDHQSTLVFKMEEKRSSKGKLRDQPTKETKGGKFSSFLKRFRLSRRERAYCPPSCGLEDPLPLNYEAQYSSIPSRKDPLWRAGATTLQGYHEISHVHECASAVPHLEANSIYDEALPEGASIDDEVFEEMLTEDEMVPMIDRGDHFDEGYDEMSYLHECESAGESSRVLTTNDPLWRAGGTTLQGHSNQLFEPTNDPITADPSKKVELVLRLVAREGEPDAKFPTDQCTPLSTLRPPPVPE